MVKCKILKPKTKPNFRINLPTNQERDLQTAQDDSRKMRLMLHAEVDLIENLKQQLTELMREKARTERQREEERIDRELTAAERECKMMVRTTNRKRQEKYHPRHGGGGRRSAPWEASASASAETRPSLVMRSQEPVAAKDLEMWMEKERLVLNWKWDSDSTHRSLK